MNKSKADLLERILDDTNQLIQISDEKSFSMMYANEPALKFSTSGEKNYKGQKCYSYMMGLKEQCPFCPLLLLSKDEKSKEVEIDNGKQVFNVKTKRIIWEGKEAFIEYASDITPIKRAQKVFESQMKFLLASIPEAQGIFHLNLTKDQCISSNGISKNIKNIVNQNSVDDLIKTISSYVPEEKKQIEFFREFKRESLLKAYELGKNELAKETLSYYDDGSVRWSRITIRFIMNPNSGDLEAVLYGMDISDEKKYQAQVALALREKQKILDRSMRDMLTGVYSKEAFEQIAKDYVRACPTQSFAIIFLDLDHFKNVNDSLGHLFGDKVIIETADKIQTAFSNKDIISRFGGDEFCMLIKNISKETLIDRLDFLQNKLRTTYEVDGKSVSTSGSFGIVYNNGFEGDVFSLIKKADEALYKSKNNGRNQYTFAE